MSEGVLIEPEPPTFPAAASSLTPNEETLLRDEMIAERIRRNHGAEETPAFLVAESLVNLLRTYSVVYDHCSESLVPYGLSLAKYNLLVVLHSADDSQLKMSEVGERMSVTCANITKLIDSLEQEGLVERKSLQGDRRVVLAALTAKGAALVQKIMPVQKERLYRSWAGLDAEECRQLTHLLVKLRRSLQLSESEGPPSE